MSSFHALSSLIITATSVIVWTLIEFLSIMMLQFFITYRYLHVPKVCSVLSWLMVCGGKKKWLVLRCWSRSSWSQRTSCGLTSVNLMPSFHSPKSKGARRELIVAGNFVPCDRRTLLWKNLLRSKYLHSTRQK